MQPEKSSSAVEISEVETERSREEGWRGKCTMVFKALVSISEVLRTTVALVASHLTALTILSA